MDKNLIRLLFVGLGLLIIGALAIANDKITNDAIEKCVNSGHSYNYCEKGLV